MSGRATNIAESQTLKHNRYFEGQVHVELSETHMPSKGNQSDLAIVGAGLIEVAFCVDGWLCEARKYSSNRPAAQMAVWLIVEVDVLLGRRLAVPSRRERSGVLPKMGRGSRLICELNNSIFF